MKLPKSLPKPKRLKLFLIRRVVGESMLPTLGPNQIILARLSRDISPGDIVVLHHGRLEKIKRVKYINDDKFFVVGDNPTESKDSRTFGFISREDILAKVVWPAA